MRLTLLENFRSMFYAPFYASSVLGSYEAEGLDVDVKMTPQLGKTLDAVIAGQAEMSWGGPMRLLYALDANPQAGCVAFCEIVGREPTLLVGSTKNSSFNMTDLRGKAVGIFKEAPTPWICLQHDLKLAGVNPSEIIIRFDNSMEENANLLRSRKIDAIQVFEPIAQQLVDEGAGHLWYASAQRGRTSFTTLFTTRKFIEENPDSVLRMTKAMNRTLKWISTHSGAELAEAVHSYLPEITLQTLTDCCNAYKLLGLWNTDPTISVEGFDWKRDAMLSCGEIKRKLTYEECVDARFAEQVAHENSISDPLAEVFPRSFPAI